MPQPTGPLHLRRGDPLPPLPLAGGFALDDYAGGWLLLAFAVQWHAGLDGEIVEVATAFGKRIKVRVVDARAELDAARRVGALVGESTWFALVILVDPRGRVQNSTTAADAVAAARAAIEF